MTSRMRMAGGSLVLMCLLGWWLSRPLATDVALTSLPTTSHLDTLLWKTFNAAPIDTLGEQHKNVDTKQSFSHVRMRYSAAAPFVVTLNPAWIVENRYALNAAERVGTVLPAGTDVTVTLPMSASVGWAQGTRQAVVYAYAPSSSMPQLLSVEPLAAGPLAGLRQLFVPEAWTLASVNFLRGYRIAGVSLSLLLGIAMIIAFVFLRKRYEDCTAALLAGMIAITMFFVRFGTDAALGTTHAVINWSQHGTLAELGDVVTIAHDLHADNRSVAACGYSDAPIAYGIFPKKLVPVQEADVAVLPVAWTTSIGGVLCGQANLRGTVTRTYADGGGIVDIETTAPLAQ